MRELLERLGHLEEGKFHGPAVKTSLAIVINMLMNAKEHAAANMEMDTLGGMGASVDKLGMMFKKMGHKKVAKYISQAVDAIAEIEG